MKSPKLRNVEKYVPPFPLNAFPSGFALSLGKEVVCHLATRQATILEGTDWEQIFARIINARWKPSNVGLDDIVLEQTAWGAKTVKNNNPAKASKVRLISGRCSPTYSYGTDKITNCDPNDLGKLILSIYNERVAAIRSHYRHVRTIVLLKSDDLLELAVFEVDTIIYPETDYIWRWNARNNLEGISRNNDEHTFTWQPHGSQFTIIQKIPKQRLAIRIKQPPLVNNEDLLKALHFDPSWIEVIK